MELAVKSQGTNAYLIQCARSRHGGTTYTRVYQKPTKKISEADMIKLALESEYRRNDSLWFVKANCTSTAHARVRRAFHAYTKGSGTNIL